MQVNSRGCQESDLPEVHAHADDTQIYLSVMLDSVAGEECVWAEGFEPKKLVNTLRRDTVVGGSGLFCLLNMWQK